MKKYMMIITEKNLTEIKNMHEFNRIIFYENMHGERIKGYNWIYIIEAKDEKKVKAFIHYMIFRHDYKFSFGPSKEEIVKLRKKYLFLDVLASVCEDR